MYKKDNILLPSIIIQEMEGCFNFRKSINVIYPNSRLRQKKPYHHLSRRKKTFDKIQYLFMIKSSLQTSSRGEFP